jgi:hypothetical protein
MLPAGMLWFKAMLEQELSPYHQELRQDLIDWELVRAGLEAYQRISGVPADDALVQLAEAADPEQRARVMRRVTRSEEEFYNLPSEIQQRLRRNES